MRDGVDIIQGVLETLPVEYRRKYSMVFSTYHLDRSSGDLRRIIRINKGILEKPDYICLLLLRYSCVPLNSNLLSLLDRILTSFNICFYIHDFIELVYGTYEGVLINDLLDYQKSMINKYYKLNFIYRFRLKKYMKRKQREP